MSRVSVVVPAFNAERYLAECLDSILYQSYHGIEVIVIDDGSTDATPFIARRYVPRIRYRRQENKGVAAALNAGIALATGDYVSFVASDDGLCRGAVAAQAAQLDRNQEAGMVHGGAITVDEEGSTLAVPRADADDPVYETSEQAVLELLRGNAVICSSVMMRRSALDLLGGFRQEFVPGEDWEMWLRVAASYDVVYLPRAIARRRVHGESLTSGFTLESMQTSHERILRSLFSESPLAAREELKTYARAANERTLAALAAVLRDRRAFARHLSQALHEQPRLIYERKTWDVAFDGAKMLLPLAVVRAARSLKRRAAPRPATA